MLQERKEAGKRGRKPGRKAAADKVDMKAKLGKQFNLCTEEVATSTKNFYFLI